MPTGAAIASKLDADLEAIAAADSGEPAIETPCGQLVLALEASNECSPRFRQALKGPMDADNASARALLLSQVLDDQLERVRAEHADMEIKLKAAREEHYAMGAELSPAGGHAQSP
jgi:hypothetical protein